MDIETRILTMEGLPDLLGLKIRGVATTERRPTHFILLVDTSGSMDVDGRLDAVKRCVTYLLQFLQSTDRISIIRFSDTASITVNYQAASSENRQAIEGYIASLHAAGSTNMSAGLLKVRDVLGGVGVDHTMKTGLVLLTDGYANRGMQDETALRSLVSLIRADAQNLSVSCVGYGYEHAGDLLRNLALEGGGSYNIVSSQEHVGTVFAEIFGGLISCVAQNVEIVYPRDYKHYTSYITHEEGAMTRLFIGDIYSESETIVLLQKVGDNNNVTLKGFHCMQMQDTVQQLQWVQESQQQQQQQAPYRMYYIRAGLAKILEKARKPGEHRENLLSDMNNLERLIEGDTAAAALMRSEFTTARQMLQNTNTLNESVCIQRSMFLSSGRGAATQMYDPDPQTPPPVRRTNGRRGIDVASATASASPFMNSVQRALSAAMSHIPSSDPV